MNTIKRNSVSANIVYQFLYQIVLFVIPLVMAPFLSRRLQENAIGVHSYIHSIAYYFVIVANLGIIKYGQRSISVNSNNEIMLRKTFWSLFYVHSVISVISLVLYISFICIFVNENKVIYFIEGIYVLSALFDITWLYYGLENFKSVVIRNFFIKAFECTFVFIFIRSPSDLVKYTVISVVSIILGQVIMIPHALTAIKPIHVDFSDCIIHIKPLFVLSISVIAISLYTVFDKTLLGFLSSKNNVAFYEYSNRIINIPRTLIGVIGTIMYPRACKMAANHDIEGQEKYMKYSFLFTILAGFGAIFGLIAIAQPFAVIYYGKSFEICGDVIISLSPLILIVGLGDIIRTQYMIPNRMDKKYTICIILNAVVNIIFTIILIPIIGIFGAVAGTVSAELFGLIFQSYLCKEILDLKYIVKTSLFFILLGSVMLFVLNILNKIFSVSFFNVALLIIIGIIIYSAGCLLYLYLFEKFLFNTIKMKVLKLFGFK